MRIWLPACCLTATALSGAACMVTVNRQGYVEHDQQRVDLGQGGELRLYTFDGAIEIRAWDRPEAVVDIEKRGDDKAAVARIQIVREALAGGGAQIEARYPASPGFTGFGVHISPSAKFVVNVPRRVNLIARSGDGQIVLERVEGRAELRTGDGAIRVVETRGDLLAETGDGSIQLDEVAGRVDARTDDGSVRLTGTPSVLRARSGDGAIVLRIRSGAAMAEDWTVTTLDGSISAELPDGFNAAIEADPGSDGHARSEFPLADAAGGDRSGRVLRGVLGAGGKTFTLRTADGTIRLVK